MDKNNFRIIKISEEALYEFIYEKFVENQEKFLELGHEDIANTFFIDWDNRSFIFCGYKFEDDNGNFIEFPKEIDLKKLIQKIPDTTYTMFKDKLYKDYSKEELLKIQEK